MSQWTVRHSALLWTSLVALGPLLVCAAAVPLRDDVDNTNVALVLVLVVVAAAALGSRGAGFLAAASSAVWFDFLMTAPYNRLTITDQSDVETTVLLLAIGFGVTELAQWGRRASARATQEEGYLAGIHDAAEAVARGSSAGGVVDEVAAQLSRLLGLRQCRFERGVAGLGDPARLQPDGKVVKRGVVWDVDHAGLPTDGEIELLVESGGLLKGRYLCQASPDAHPTLAQRLVAVTLASQVGSALT
jgi:K+-sensing histidine kinase KdpD